MTSRWIFSSFKYDFWALWGLAFVLLVALHPALLSVNPAKWALIFICFVCVDTGHAYVTGLRTYFNKDARQTSLMMWYVPIVCLVTMFCWAFFGLPYYWSFVIYYTFYHHLKQHYGIMAWYSKINHSYSKGRSFFLYSLNLVPFFSLHFRDLDYLEIYTKNEFLVHPNLFIHSLLVIINLILLFIFFVYSLYNIKKGEIKWPVVCSILFPAIVSFLSFNYGHGVEQIVLPLLVIHGVGYFFLTGYVLKKQNKIEHSIRPLVFLIVSVAVFFGVGENLLAENFVEYLDSEKYRGEVLMSLAASIIVVPSLTHYILDGFIWRKSDPIFGKIFQ